MCLRAVIPLPIVLWTQSSGKLSFLCLAAESILGLRVLFPSRQAPCNCIPVQDHNLLIIRYLLQNEVVYYMPFRNMAKIELEMLWTLKWNQKCDKEYIFDQWIIPNKFILITISIYFNIKKQWNYISLFLSHSCKSLYAWKMLILSITIFFRPGCQALKMCHYVQAFNGSVNSVSIF